MSHSPRFARVFVALSLIATADPLAAQGRALRIEDWYRVKTVGAPQISPDGRWVAYTVTSRYEDNNADSSAVWVVAADASSAPRRVSRAGSHATAPSWDDAGRLAFNAGGCRMSVDPARPDAPDAGCITQQGSTMGRRIPARRGDRRLR